MRPTGKLHIGHLVGALTKWADLQADYDCLYFVADWHAIILHCLGPDHHKLVYNRIGLDERLTSVFEARAVKEILA